MAVIEEVVADAEDEVIVEKNEVIENKAENDSERKEVADAEKDVDDEVIEEKNEVIEKKTENNSEPKEVKEPAAAAEAAAPAAPPAPEIKLSQILPMVAMFGLQKFNLEEMGYIRHVEIAYVIIQLLNFTVLYLIYDRIGKMGDDGSKIKIPEVKQMGQVVSPATEQTRKEYDMAKLKEALKQPLIGCLITGGIYYKWGSFMPLVMQVLMTPMQLYEAPLTQIHILGKAKSRPFPTPNPFGLPSAPEPEAQAEVADSASGATVQDKKDQ